MRSWPSGKGCRDRIGLAFLHVRSMISKSKMYNKVFVENLFEIMIERIRERGLSYDYKN